MGFFFLLRVMLIHLSYIVSSISMDNSTNGTLSMPLGGAGFLGSSPENPPLMHLGSAHEIKRDLADEQKHFLNKFTKGSWSYNPDTGLVDVKGNFYCSDSELGDFMGIQFGRIGWNFDCSNNSLTSLEGAPREVGGSFDCSSNSLTSLEGAPQEVGENFYCTENKLTSLAGAPQEVWGNFYCGRSLLTSLAGAPKVVDGDFYCWDNKITSLEGGPQEVGGDYNCKRNDLTSLKGAAKKVGGSFNCFLNPLTSLEGAPEEVGYLFSCDALVSTSLEWNMEGWIEMFDKGNDEVKQLVLSLLSAEEINKRIAQDPAGMVMMLKGVWNSPIFKEIRSQLIWPEGFEKSIQRAGGLADVGL